ncbi:MAG: transcriptional regulator, BadM/Rrf2 family [Massilia sp.]|jgi:Rrf2 family protein|nr:transcriptional regulator, BadM/Rrf2 family [Phycisphaerales bacterium]MDB5911271.1 transcriptional regulator, BadM/Rrf2 family [Massilia sp.]
MEFPCRRPEFLSLCGDQSLRLSKQTEYGLRAVVQLARLYPRTFVQSRDLSQAEGLPTKFLEAILLTLRRGGFLESKVGREGGYRLARPPKDIRVGEVVRRLEGRLTATDAHRTTDLSPGEVAVHLLNDRLTQATDTVLDSLTLEQLMEHVNRSGNTQQQMYYI